MSDLDGRLRELRQATDGQLRPSVELLARIESSLEPRARWRFPVMVVAAAVVVAVVLAVVSMPTRGADQRVVARPPTRAEYVDVMNAGCEDYVRETEGIQVVFPTPEAYALVAENRMAALMRSLDRMRSVGAPRDAGGLVEQVTGEATSAQASAQAALGAARTRDTASAAGALAQVDTAVNRVGTLLAAYGAMSCLPPEGR